MADYRNLTKARAVRNDEYYTRMVDIENEVWLYRDNFEGKVVYLNCDDYRYSNFFKYFVDNFSIFKLKRVIATHYSAPNLLNYNKPMVAVYDSNGLVVKEMEGDGSYDSVECLNILKECDIVITNPPFSIFRAYIEVVFNSKKEFLILCSHLAPSLKNMFDNRNLFRIGFNEVEWFDTPDGLKDVGCIWITNMNYEKENEKKVISLEKKYDESVYKKYDNYDAVEVKYLKDIPIDYDGVIGVPVTFLYKKLSIGFKIIELKNKLKFEGKTSYKRVMVKREW